MRSRTRAGLAGAFVIGGLVLAGCGGDDSGNAGDDGGNGGTTADIVVHANDALKFDKETYNATAGENVIELINDGGQAHTLLFDDDSIDFEKLGVTGQGDTDEGSVELPAGTYTIYCDIAGHRAAGMEAKIVVN